MAHRLNAQNYHSTQYTHPMNKTEKKKKKFIEWRRQVSCERLHAIIDVWNSNLLF